MEKMILLLGASGYVGQAFQDLFNNESIPYLAVSRQVCNYYDRETLCRFIQKHRPAFLLNAAGYTGKPNVDACELHKTDCLLGNAILPGILREACEREGLAWGHVSSGCIYSGRQENGKGFTEKDPPNFSFRTNNSSFYSGSKALGEELLQDARNCFIWRLRIPFNHKDSKRNYLSKLLRYPKLLEAENSISHLGDFVQACWDCVEKQVPYGTYNVTNPGEVTTRNVVKLLKRHLVPGQIFEFFENEDVFMQYAAKTPRSNCVLDSTKIQDAGILMRPVDQAIVDSLEKWVWE